jgi:hypothetical protein
MTESGWLVPIPLKLGAGEVPCQYVAVIVAHCHKLHLSLGAQQEGAAGRQLAGVNPPLFLAEAVVVTYPTKQQVQHYLQQRRESKAPPPSPEEIRRQLGWGMVPSVRDTGR